MGAGDAAAADDPRRRGNLEALASSSSRRNGDWVPAPTIQWISGMA